LVPRLHSAALVINRVMIGYGYRPARAGLWLLAILIAAIALTTLAAHTHDSTGNPAAIRPAAPTNQPVALTNPQAHPCSEGEQLGLATRIAIPVLNNVTQGNCQLTTAHTPGEWYALAGFLLLALAWATATLTVIGYTNLIRRT
jgi:hypothetical protein